jgi:5-methylcytosine-specific restriction protein A
MRTVPEWIGKTDDTEIPPRVKDRIFDHFGGVCNLCGRKTEGKTRPCFDHIISIASGGANREKNIQLLCDWCHGQKTKLDVALKAKNARIRARDRGIRKVRRPMPGSKASGLKKRMDGIVERRTQSTR